MADKKRKTFIIAEAGVNHNGSIDLAMDMVDCAAAAGADAIKFQSFHADRLVSEFAPKAGYQLETTPGNESQKEMLARLALTPAEQTRLFDYARKRKVQFLSSPFDLESIDFLSSLGLGLYKIPSGEITNLPYLRKMGSLGGQIIMSTGMSEIHEVRAAVSILECAGTKRQNMVLLHCTTQYPAPFDSVNLKAMTTMGQSLDVAVGYSDHTPGISVSLAAVAMGACVIEKHFTLDKTMKGPDHRASMDPGELERLVAGIREVEDALGTNEKQVTPAERGNRDVIRKSIVAAVAIEKGERFSEENLTTKRPGTGLSPMAWDSVMGRTAERSYKQDEGIDP